MNKPIQKRKTRVSTRKAAPTKSRAKEVKSRKNAKAVSQFLTENRAARFRKAVTKIQSMTNQELKDILRANQQSMTGNKNILFSKVAHGMVFGRIPKCSNCSGGRPFFNLATGEYTCHGYQDDCDYVECGHVQTYDVMKNRMLPWEMSPITTEDEDEEEESDDE